MEEQPEVSKPSKLRKLLKILKIAIIILIALAIFVVGYFAYLLSREDLFGWRLNFSLSKVKTKDYQSFGPTIAFRYPSIFDLDLDSNKRYGKDYLVGIKLKTDDRTGCDIRMGGPNLDFNRPVDDLAKEITGPIQEKASDFKVIEKRKISLDGQSGFRISFSFMDPIGARIRLDEVFTRGKDKTRYMIICGAGEYQFGFFEKDFEVFYDSITFEGKLIKNENSWEKILNFIGKKK